MGLEDLHTLLNMLELGGKPPQDLVVLLWLQKLYVLVSY